MNGLHGRPTIEELLAAAKDFLHDELLPTVDEDLRFKLLVTINVLVIVGREIEMGPTQEQDHLDRLAAFGATSDRELASLIRERSVDPALRGQLRELIQASVRDKLAVSNPKYLKDETP